MSRCGSFLVACLLWAIVGGPARSSEPLTLDADLYWTVLASSRDLDQAIGIARYYRFQNAPIRVVSSANGWYAIVRGPDKVSQGRGTVFLDSLRKTDNIPVDAYLSQGNGFVRTVWQPAATHVASAVYDGSAPTSLQDGDLSIAVSSIPVGGGKAAHVAGTYQGVPAFTMNATENADDNPSAEVRLLNLTGAAAPDVVLTHFWNGAHCCTVTKIATLLDSRWSVVDGENLDGNVGYDFEDLDGDGKSELISSDNSFLYLFAPYATSVAPIRIHRLEHTSGGASLADVTASPAYRHRVLQDIGTLEYMAKVSPDNGWHSNAFLAAWVADEMTVGEGAPAWARMLDLYDRNPDFGPEECLDRLVSVADCPQSRLVRIDFPIALKQHLIERGYMSPSDDYPVPPAEGRPRAATPPAREPEPSAPPPEAPDASAAALLKKCNDATDVVRKIVLRIFLNRENDVDELYDQISTHDDVTVEDNDPSIMKLTCAVTYDISVKRLIGWLAENGDIRRAATLSQLMQRMGPVISKRIKYTVKPIAGEARVWVEVLN